MAEAPVSEGRANTTSSPPREGDTFDRDLQRRIGQSLDGYTAWLQEFLRIPSPRMEEHNAIRYLARKLQRSRCSVKIFEGDGIGEPTPAGRPINLLAHRKGFGGGRSLIVSAHIDSVPAGDPKKWKLSPWSGHIEDGRIYARGAHDDRTGGAIICMMVDLLNQLSIHTRGDIYMLATTEEENSCGGIRAFLRSRDYVQADAVLEVDGNGVNDAITGLAGALSFHIRVEGPYGTTQNTRYVHDANPIELMGELIRALRQFERELPVELGWTNTIVAVTEFNTRGWFSNVPEESTVAGFANVMPPFTNEEYKSRFEAFIQNAARRIPWLQSHPPAITWSPLDLPRLVTPESSDFVNVLRQAHLKAFAAPLRTRKLGGWSDVQLLGNSNTVLYGPGGGGGDHAYNEYFELKTLAPMLRSLAHLVVDWCGRTS